MTSFTRTTALSLMSLFIALFAASPSYSQETGSSQGQQQRTRQAQAVSRSVYDKIVAAQELASEEDYSAGLRVLNKMLESARLSDYERSQVLQNTGRLQLQLQNMPQAIAAFEKVLLIADLEEQTRKTTLYILAQLHSAEGNYEVALRYLSDWFSLEPNPGSAPHVLRGQNLYQLGRYAEMIPAIESAIEVAYQRGKPAKENWYVLLSYGYFQDERFANVRDIHKVLIENWPSKRYWLSLAGAYAELNEAAKLISAYDVAHTQGLLSREGELITMAQLYMQHEVPYNAAQLLHAAIANGTVSGTEKTYRLLSQAWTMAQEDEKSIPALRNAAKLGDDGTIDLRLGNAYLNLGRNAECVEAIKNGLNKGGLKNPGHAHLSMGTCYFNQREYRAAKRAFRLAAESPAIRRTARSWIEVIRVEIARDEEIAKAEAKAREQQQLLNERRAATKWGRTAVYY